MEMKKRGASKTAALCTAAAVAAGAPGCVGVSNLTKSPEPLECPAGSRESMAKNFGVYRYDRSISGTFGQDPHATAVKNPVPVEVQEGQKVTLVVIDAAWPSGPNGENAILTGQVTLGAWRGKPSAFVRITYGTTPGGKKGPMCLCAVTPLQEGSKVHRELEFLPVKRFYEDCYDNTGIVMRYQ